MTHPATALDDTVHQRFRLGILAILSHGDKVEFGYLQTALGLSAGNLSRHLTTLAEAGLIRVNKGYHGRRPRTWVTMTKTGRSAYRAEIAVLRSLLALADALATSEPDSADHVPDATEPEDMIVPDGDPGNHE